MAGADTPVMRQYKKLRDENPDFLLFFRMGDFYELFGEQAETAAGILGITLTKRRTAKEGDGGIPMCGVPFHAAEGYIAKLIRHGHKVALCEQTETPEEAKKRDGSKALVRREVVRLYTGGTLTEESMLKPEENNYLASMCEAQGSIAISWAELSTGELFTQTVSAENLAGELARLGAKEVLLSEKFYINHKEILTPFERQISPVEARLFESSSAEEKLKKELSLGTLESLGFENRAQLSSLGALLFYIERTQSGKVPSFMVPEVKRSSSNLYIDATTKQNLELTETLRGERKGSLLDTLDATCTPSGSRLLARWITTPLQELGEIQNRQESIEVLLKEGSVRANLRELLKETSDISRSLSRITLERGSPRDLGAIKRTLNLLPKVGNQINSEKFQTPLFKKFMLNFGGFEGFANLLERSLKSENLPLLARDGGFIREGFCEAFDRYHALTTGGMAELQKLEQKEVEETGISSLRVKYNKVWGYFFEVTKTHQSKVPERYIHRQTTTNSQRFSTTELMELEREYSAAQVRSLEREQEIFGELVAATKALSAPLLAAASALAELDVLCSAAEIAEKRNYIRPVVDTSNAFDIEGGRHVVVERTVENYVPSSTELSGGKLWLITGPNMAGKSTFLRQNAVTALMAHMGFFVPAAKAHIGVIDRIFTRIGAADDLAKGQSTFMMEMVETASILNGATSRSLVVLDEIGRGTATYDGLSIAWACVEYLVEKIKCRGLFATHYHEMTELENTYKTLECHHASVKEWDGEIIFLHEIKRGAAPHSYGIHVGKLAGLPSVVTKRASQILHKLEQGNTASEQTTLPLFSARPEENEPSQTSEVEEKLLELSLDDLTPRQAHELLYSLKGMAQN